jgi:hypothetical protein
MLLLVQKLVYRWRFEHAHFTGQTGGLPTVFKSADWQASLEGYSYQEPAYVLCHGQTVNMTKLG